MKKESTISLLHSFFLVFLFILFGAGSCGKTELKNGDLIFQASKSSQSRAIELATNSPLSHVGMVIYQKGAPWVFEAVGPVLLTPLNDWVKHGAGERYAIARYASSPDGLSPEQVKLLIRAGKKYMGRGYDLYFQWSDELLYCSELVWKVYRDALGVELAPLRRLKDYDLSSPEVQKLMQKRYGNHIPLDEKVVTPADLYKSDKLIKVIPW